MRVLLALLLALPLLVSAQTSAQTPASAPAAKPHAAGGAASAPAVAKRKLTALAVTGEGIQLLTLQADRGNLTHTGSWQLSPGSLFDSELLAAVSDAVKAAAPDREIKTYTTSTRSLFGDPAGLFVDGKLTLPGTLGDALRLGGATHLFMVTRAQQAPALVPALPDKIATPLEGAGFVIDLRPTGQIGMDGNPGLPILAAYLSLRVALVDMKDYRLVKEQSIIVGQRLPVERGVANPFVALSPEARLAALKALVAAELPQAIKALLPK